MNEEEFFKQCLEQLQKARALPTAERLDKLTDVMEAFFTRRFDEASGFVAN